MSENAAEIVDDQVPAEQAAPADESGEHAQVDESTEGQTDESTEQKQDQNPRWYQKRIDKMTRDLREAQRQAAALEAMLERGEKPNPAEGIEDQVHKRAAEIVEAERRNEAANQTYQNGKSAHSDFDSAVQNLAQVTDLTQRADFIDAVTSLPNGHEVYYHLGKNLDDADRVLSLPPVKMALELAKIAAKLGAPSKQSKAPPPIKPIGGKAAPSGDLSDDLPMDEWLKRRSETARRKR